MTTRHDQVARRAFERFEARGCQHGHDWDDWFAAEREVLASSDASAFASSGPLIFLFGAGASFGAKRVQPERPPLMKQLFDRLAEKYPSKWGSQSTHWSRRDDFRTNFEETFNDLVWKPPPFTTPSLTLAEELLPIAHYFGGFTLMGDGEDCYSTLLRALERAGRLKHTTLASLNYDCLLEQAAAIVGVNVEFVTSDSRPQNGTVPILKLHGSCNFVGEIDQYGRAMLAGSGVHLETRVRVLSPFDSASPWVSSRGGSIDRLPIICQLSSNKDAVLAPAMITAIRNRWSAALDSAGYLAVIGVSFNVADTYVVDAIREVKVVLYVGGNDDFSKWRTLSPRVEHLGTEFEGALPKLFGRLGLLETA